MILGQIVGLGGDEEELRPPFQQDGTKSQSAVIRTIHNKHVQLIQGRRYSCVFERGLGLGMVYY
ncbi:hypothetical protein J6590_034701 [Homalodisca vitripennis]|nr:hypothetical protein J6590_034701 [Homalodisca vitripennis]